MKERKAVAGWRLERGSRQEEEKQGRKEEGRDRRGVRGKRARPRERALPGALSKGAHVT